MQTNSTADAMAQCGPYEQALYLQYQLLGESAYTNPPTNKALAMLAGMCVNRMKKARARLAALGLIEVAPVISAGGYCNQPPAVRLTDNLSSGDTPTTYHDTPLSQHDTPYHDVTPTTGNVRALVCARGTESLQQEPEKKKTNTARAHEAPPARRVQPRAKAHSRASQPVHRKPYEDVEHGVRWGIINAWCSNLRAQPIGAFKSDANHETAAELARAGYSERDVERFVQAKRNDPYWNGKTLKLQKVAELLPEWLAANRPKPRFVTDDAFLSEEELNAIRPTGTEYLVTYAH